MIKIGMSNYLIIALLSICIFTACSRNLQTEPNSESVVLISDDVQKEPNAGNIILISSDFMGFNRYASIEEIHKDLIERQYQEISLRDDRISAKTDFFGLSSDIYFRFFNGKLYRMGISYLGFPGEPEGDDDHTLEDIFAIKEAILKVLTENYGEPEEIRHDERRFVGEVHYFKWNLSDNWKLEFSLRIEHFILTACWIDVRYTNTSLLAERRLADEISEAAVEESFIEEIVNMDTAIQKAHERAAFVRQDEAAMTEYIWREMALSDWNSAVGFHTRETAKEIARKMKADNMPLEQIIKYSGLTENQIKAL